MDVGKPVRIHEVEPLADPVPREDSPVTAPERPDRKPEPVEAPAR